MADETRHAKRAGNDTYIEDLARKPDGMTADQAMDAVFRSVYKHYDLLHIGDSNHTSKELKAFLFDNPSMLDALQKNGASVIFIEQPRGMQSLIDEAMQKAKTGEIKIIDAVDQIIAHLAKTDMELVVVDPRIGGPSYGALILASEIHYIENADRTDPYQMAGLAMRDIANRFPGTNYDDAYKIVLKEMGVTDAQYDAALKQLSDLDVDSYSDLMEKIEDTDYFKHLVEYANANNETMRERLVTQCVDKIFDGLMNEDVEKLTIVDWDMFGGLEPGHIQQEITGFFLRVQPAESDALWATAKEDPEAAAALKERLRGALTGLNEDDAKILALRADNNRLQDRELAESVGEKLLIPSGRLFNFLPEYHKGAIIYGAAHGEGSQDFNEYVDVKNFKITTYANLNEFLSSDMAIVDKPELVYIVDEKKFYTTSETPHNVLRDLKKEGFEFSPAPELLQSQFDPILALEQAATEAKAFSKSDSFDSLIDEYIEKMHKIMSEEGTDQSRKLEIASLTERFCTDGRKALFLLAPQEATVFDSYFTNMEKTAAGLKEEVEKGQPVPVPPQEDPMIKVETPLAPPVTPVIPVRPV